MMMCMADVILCPEQGAAPPWQCGFNSNLAHSNHRLCSHLMLMPWELSQRCYLEVMQGLPIRSLMFLCAVTWSPAHPSRRLLALLLALAVIIIVIIIGGSPPPVFSARGRLVACCRSTCRWRSCLGTCWGGLTLHDHPKAIVGPV